MPVDINGVVQSLGFSKLFNRSARAYPKGQALQYWTKNKGFIMFQEEVSLSLADLPSQTSTDERMGLYHLAKNQFIGHGYIYDIGTAAGGSTVCLDRGLADNEIDDNAKLKKL
jgi:hypothetical protein